MSNPTNPTLAHAPWSISWSSNLIASPEATNDSRGRAVSLEKATIEAALSSRVSMSGLPDASPTVDAPTDGRHCCLSLDTAGTACKLVTAAATATFVFCASWASREFSRSTASNFSLS